MSDTDNTTQNSAVELPSNAILNDDGSVTVTLQESVQLTKDGVPEESVTLHPLRGKDMVTMLNCKSDGDRSAALICAAAGKVGPLGQSFINAISAADFITLAQVATHFLGSGQTNTGISI